MVATDRRSRRTSSKTEAGIASEVTSLAADSVNVQDLLFDTPSMESHPVKEQSPKAFGEPTNAVLPALARLPTPARNNATAAGDRGVTAPLVEPACGTASALPGGPPPPPSTPAPAPWQLSDKADASPQAPAGSTLSYRDQLRANGQQAMQRPWNRGMPPKGPLGTAPSASNLTVPASAPPTAPPTLPPSFAASRSSLSGTMPNSALNSVTTGGYTPGGMMTPGGMSTTSFSSNMTLPPGSMMPGSMTPGNMTPGSCMTTASNMTDPFGLLCGAPPPTPATPQMYADQSYQAAMVPDPQYQVANSMSCQWGAQGQMNPAHGVSSWDGSTYWPTETNQMPMMTTAPPPPAMQGAVAQPFENQQNMMSTSMPQMAPPGQQQSLMAIAMPQMADGNIDNQQLTALLEAAANAAPYED